MTGTWLPEPGKTVHIIVNEASDITIRLVDSNSDTLRIRIAANKLITSAYPGQCTNFGAGDEADFDSLDQIL